MKQRYCITVKGKRHTWAFVFEESPEGLADWRADGLEIGVVANVIPAWVVNAGLMRPWIAAQDAWRWLRCF